MSGHSKWNNIKRKKEKTDAQKAKVFTRIGRELAMAVKAGGPDPNVNGKLRDVIAKAKANNVPNDNIERMLKKVSGEDNSNYEEIIYEGYGPAGIAVIVETLTDNRNRTAGEMRHYFDKNGGNLGQSGSVMFMFERKGVIVIESDGLDEDTVMEDALEAGADDFNVEDGVFEITTDPNSVDEVSRILSDKGYKFVSAEAEYVPNMTNDLTDEEAVFKMNRLLEMLEENDDVQYVWHNWNEPEEEDELAKAQQEAADARDSYLRLKAEWDNFRKRTAAERESEKIRASEKLVKDLIPVIDDLERAIDHAKQIGEGGSLTEGVEAITTKFLQILAKSKVEQIEAVGEPFDPNKHQAVGTQPDDSVPEETVLTVYQKGYQMGDRVLRPAMVVTSTK